MGGVVYDGRTLGRVHLGHRPFLKVLSCDLNLGDGEGRKGTGIKQEADVLIRTKRNLFIQSKIAAGFLLTMAKYFQESSEKLLLALSITQISKDDYAEISGLFQKSLQSTLTRQDF